MFTSFVNRSLVPVHSSDISQSFCEDESVREILTPKTESGDIEKAETIGSRKLSLKSFSKKNYERCAANKDEKLSLCTDRELYSDEEQNGDDGDALDKGTEVCRARLKNICILST